MWSCQRASTRRDALCVNGALVSQLPVDSDSHEGEHAGRHRARWDELSELAVEATERPVVVQQEDEVEHGVEHSYHCVGHGQIHQEVIGNCAHALVAEHDPDYDEIAARSNSYHGDKHRNERHLTSQTALSKITIVN